MDFYVVLLFVFFFCSFIHSFFGAFSRFFFSVIFMGFSGTRGASAGLTALGAQERF